MNRVYRDPDPNDKGGAAPEAKPAPEVKPEQPTLGSAEDIAGDLGIKAPEVKPEAEPEVKPEVKPEGEVKPEAEAKPEVKPEVKPEPVAEKPDIAVLLAEHLKQQKEVVEALRPKPAAPEPPKPLELYQVTPEMYEQILESPEKGVAILNEISKQTTAQSVKLMLGVLNEVMKPVQQYIDQQKMVEAETAFAGKYPDLKDDLDICKEIAAKMDLTQYDSREAVFEHVAKTARDFISKYKARFGVTPPAGAGNGESKVKPTEAPAGAKTREREPASKTEVEKDLDLLYGSR